MSASQNPDWPAITRESRPWTRWWWMGSAVSEAEITRHLQIFRDAGIGGVEISPIYAATGDEERAIPFLSPRWVEMLAHTLREARRLDLGVDLITGTGWPLGGPWVPDADAPARLLFETFTLAVGGRVEEPIRSPERPSARLIALMAYSPDGRTLDLGGRVDATGYLDWIAPDGPWTLRAAFLTETGQQVKRAAPGGEGNVLDHLSGDAVRRYLAHFDAPLSLLPAGETVRCFFNDSYEVFGANGTAGIFAEFRRRRGYELKSVLPALNGEGDADLAARVRSDYRRTVGELVLENFTQVWADWAHGRGARVRNQAHGSPGNLLDLYAAVDIPETEVFGPTALDLMGLEPLPGTAKRGKAEEEVLICKLASSAAHLSGRPLCSSESFTWLGEHGRVPLDHVRAEADLLFALGINHIFFHGTPFSPADLDWPGRLFYASTHFGPTNPFWRDLPALNAYIARCQSFLQAGRPDNDVLLYLPISDLWMQETSARKDLLPLLTVGDTARWMRQGMPGFTAAGRLLWERGWGFDCVSDRLLEGAVRFSDGELRARGGAAYRALVLPACALLPPETLERIVALAREGATVLVVGELPRDVPGLGDLENRRRRLRAASEALGPRRAAKPGITQCSVGRGRFLIGEKLDALLEFAGVARESVVDAGVEFVRRRGEDGERRYFFANLGRERLDAWVPLGVPARSAILLDPMTGDHGAASVRQENGRSRVYLQMEPGESRLLRARDGTAEAAAWGYFSSAGEGIPLAGEWRVAFIEGGPTLPPPAAVRTLTSWTEWPGEALRAFSGTARYTLAFDRPAVPADAWALDLGAVCHSARVRLNGAEIGALVARPFRLRLPGTLGETGNVLEIEVTNLMANRLADLDRRRVPWKNFYFVNIEYKPFDASEWEPLPSGLLGPIRLLPLRRGHA